MIAAFPESGKKIKVAYTNKFPVDATFPDASFNSFVAQVKAAYPGGWPISATGGFLPTAWEKIGRAHV